MFDGYENNFFNCCVSCPNVTKKRLVEYRLNTFMKFYWHQYTFLEISLEPALVITMQYGNGNFLSVKQQSRTILELEYHVIKKEII